MSFTHAEIETGIMEELAVMLEELGEDLDSPVGPTTTLVQDVGFASIDFVQFAVAIEERFDKKFGFQDLLIQDGNYIDDLTVREVVDFVTSRLNGAVAGTLSEEPTAPAVDTRPAPVRITELPDGERIDADKLAAFRRLIKPRFLRPLEGTPNPPAVFVLSPPRSGTTLLRIMLAGNPALFAPPELHLLAYGDMAERRESLQSEHHTHLLEGTVRAIMSLRGVSGHEARTFLDQCAAERMSTKRFYAELQEALPGGRMLVDKTPTYVVASEIMQQAEVDFENPLYIHLLRHPCGNMRSYEESKLERIMPMLNDSEFSGRQLAEMNWLHCHQNVLDFKQRVPAERFCTLAYEDMVQNPDAAMQHVCDFLGIEFHPDMVNPYADKTQRMTDGVDTSSKMSGDLKFHLHHGIDAGAATRWEKFYSTGILGDMTCNMARELGYEI